MFCCSKLQIVDFFVWIYFRRLRGCQKRHRVYDSLDLHGNNANQLKLPAEGSVKVCMIPVKVVKECVNFEG